MRKIDYPTDAAAINAFHNRYRKSVFNVDKAEINRCLRRAPKYKGQNLTFNRLITFDFESLYELTLHLAPFISRHNGRPITRKTPGGKTKTIIPNSFNALFDYKNNQPDLARFFMNEEGLNMKMCYYCGIDHVNSFKEIGDYKNGLDFLQRAPYDELQVITGIGEAKANAIIQFRKSTKIKKPEDITSAQTILNGIKNFNKIKHSHNHFTLDHVLPQSKYPFLSLCLYNLTPSCSPCNSKFKGAKDFINSPEIIRISPTSSAYSLTSDFDFRIFYTGKLQGIKSVQDFTLYRKVKRNKAQIEKYNSIFKLDGRYTIHKSELMEMIKTKTQYSEKVIRKMANEWGLSAQQVKNMLFEKDIFEEDLNKPLHKLKRDIAKNIKIIK